MLKTHAQLSKCIKNYERFRLNNLTEIYYYNYDIFIKFQMRCFIHNVFIN